MPNVRIRDNEPFEVALRRFKRTCEKAGVLTDVRKKEAFEKPSMERKRKRGARGVRKGVRGNGEYSRLELRLTVDWQGNGAQDQDAL